MIPREHDVLSLFCSRIGGKECQKTVTERARYSRSESRVRSAKPRVRGQEKESLSALMRATRPQISCPFSFFFAYSPVDFRAKERQQSTDRKIPWGNIYSRGHFFKTLNKRQNVTSRTSTPRMPPQDKLLFPQ